MRTTTETPTLGVSTTVVYDGVFQYGHHQSSTYIDYRPEALADGTNDQSPVTNYPRATASAMPHALRSQLLAISSPLFFSTLYALRSTLRAAPAASVSEHHYFITPSSLPIFSNAATALSMCSFSCAADSCTRILACSLGTTG